MTDETLTEDNYRHYIVVIKLNNGEEIVCAIDDTSYDIENKLIIFEPAVIRTQRIAAKNRIIESYVLEQWMKFCDDIGFELSTTAILVMADAQDELCHHYYNFIKNLKTKSKSDQLPNLEEEEENFEEEDYEDDNFLAKADVVNPTNLKPTIH